jgi:uncharacterized membrane protein
MSAIPNLNELFNEIVNEGNVQLVEWLFFGFILVGIIIKVISLNIHTTLTPDQVKAGLQTIGPATGSIWGYSIILFATMGLIFISVNPQKENLEQIATIPISLYAILIILLWCIVLNFRFYDKINTTPIMPQQYDLWSNWSIVIIIFLSVLCIMEYLITSLNKPAFNGLKSQIRLFTILIFFSGIIVMGIQDTILSSFLVDG